MDQQILPEGEFIIYLFALLSELPLLLGTLPLAALNIYVLLKTRIIHLNLRLLLMAQSAVIIQRSLARIGTIGVKFSGPNILWREADFLPLYLLLFTATKLRNNLSHMMILERVLANLWVKKYERVGSIRFTAFWICSLSFMTGMNIKMSFTADYKSNTLLNLLPYCMETLPTIFLLAKIAFLSRLSRRRFFAPKITLDAYSLSCRYQQLENVRTIMELMIFCGLLKSLGMEEFVNAIASLLQTIFCVLILLGTLLLHPFLARSSQRAVGRFWRFVLLKGNQINSWSANGAGFSIFLPKDTSKNAEDEVDRHFHTLEAIWEGKANEKCTK